MTDTNEREPVKAITETTESVFKKYDKATDTWTNIHVLANGRADILAAWTSASKA